MKKILLLLFVTALFQVNAQDLSQLKNNLNQKSFKGQPIETDVLAINAKRDSISILNQPQRLVNLMTDTSEVRLDSTLILNESRNSKAKTVYNNIGQITRVDNYRLPYPNVTYNQFCASGYDTDPTILTVNAEEIEYPNESTLILNNLNMNYIVGNNNQGEFGCSYFVATLSVIGGVSDGVSITGCNDQMSGLDLTGFNSLSLTTSDFDNYIDELEMCLYIEVISYDIDPNEFIIVDSTLYEYDDNGNQILYDNTLYSQDGSVFSRARYELQYNENSNILTYKIYYLDNNQESLYLGVDQERFYDESGYYIEGQQFTYSPDGSISYGLKYEFTNDNDGLWYYRTSYQWDNNAGFFLVVQEDEKAKFENFNTNITLKFNGSSSLGTLSPQSKEIFSRDGFNTVYTDYNWNADKEAYIPFSKTYYNRTYFDDGESLETYEAATSNWNTETDSFEYTNYLYKYNSTYDINGRQIFESRFTYSTENQEFIAAYIVENQYDDNGNLIFNNTSNYQEYDSGVPTLGSWLNTRQRDFSYNDNGFISQRMYSSGSYETSESEYVTAYFKDDYSTILDSETNFIRMGTPSLSDDGTNWENIQGPSFKSYYWYTQNSSLSTEDDSGSRIGLYPNPTNSVLLLNSNVPHKIEVYDLGGRKIIESIGVEIDISSLSNATYVVKIIDLQSNEFVSKKIIKE